MSPTRYFSHDLLTCNAQYGVLICRECRYAIQKSAIRSHLLRHKIYRDERQHLLASIAQLELLEPDRVPLPPPDSAPIEGLPIISGYHCTVTRCEYLCASSKRMRRHRSEVHGHSEASDSSSCARLVKLQTFFRGTKLKYFEVTPLSAACVSGEASLATTVDDEQGHEKKVPTTQGPTETPRMPTPPMTPLESSPAADLNLETLTYFHHFTTTTSLTLPCGDHSAHYWQTEVVLQALRTRWLMCGLLAISACHLAVLADDTTTEHDHREQMLAFCADFFIGWEAASKGVVIAAVAKETKNAGDRIRCVLRCATWASGEASHLQAAILELTAPSLLQSILTKIRDLVVPELTRCLDRVPNDSDDGQRETFLQAKGSFEPRSSSDSGSFDTFSFNEDSFSSLHTRLQALPSHMAETFGKPEHVRDVLATLSAIATLVDCCDISFVSDDAGVAWECMAMWLTKIPDHFHHLVSQHSPAALVVLAYWAASLVKRAEHCGCWFLRGLTKAILQPIKERLIVDDHAVQSLIEGLMG